MRAMARMAEHRRSGDLNMVRLSILALALMAASPALAASDIPHLNIQQTCQNEAKQDPADYSITGCVGDENKSRVDLEKQWPSFSAASRQFCTEESGSGWDPSYVELLTCLQMHDAASAPQSRPPKLGRMSY
jgi:hypothetical protein